MEIEQKGQLKLVGYIFDEKLTWAPMIDKLAKKARSRLGMLTRLRSLLDDHSMMNMYTSFIRPIMEYGSVCFMGAKPTHLGKLDAIQRTAEKIGKFKVESLAQRRNAAAITLTCKLLDGRGRGVLREYVPQVLDASNHHGHNTTSCDSGMRLVSKVTAGSLDLFRDSYLGSIDKMWDRIPAEVKSLGSIGNHGWEKYKRTIKKSVIDKVTNSWDLNKKSNQREKQNIEFKLII